jgi:hypothetical protein
LFALEFKLLSSDRKLLLLGNGLLSENLLSDLIGLGAIACRFSVF